MQHSYTFSSFYIHLLFLYILTNIFILKVDKKHIILFTRVKLHKIIVLFTVLMSLLLPNVHNLLTFFLLHKPLSYAIIILVVESFLALTSHYKMCIMHSYITLTGKQQSWDCCFSLYKRAVIWQPQNYILSSLLRIFAISSYSLSFKYFFSGFIVKVEPHSSPPSYLGTRCICKWHPVSPYIP